MGQENDRKESGRDGDYISYGQLYLTYPSLMHLVRQQALPRHRYYPEYNIFVIYQCIIDLIHSLRTIFPLALPSSSQLSFSQLSSSQIHPTRPDHSSSLPYNQFLSILITPILRPSSAPNKNFSKHTQKL